MKNFFVSCLSAVWLTCGASAHAAGLDTELLVNGDAEAGGTAGWVSTGMNAISSTGAAPGTAGLPPGTSLGNFVFTGGTGAASGQSLSQAVGVDSLAAVIDAGSVTSGFSVLVQSRSLDPASGQLRFLGAANESLAIWNFADPVTSVFDWSLYSDVRTVPAGTRSIEVYLLARRTTGVSSDAYFDNASLVLTTPVPEPAAAWLLLCGIPLIALRRAVVSRGAASATAA